MMADYGNVRVVVRETAIHRYYASSPDLPGLHVYTRREEDLAKEISTAIRELYDAKGSNVRAAPQSGGPRALPWVWSVEELPARACA